MESLKEFIENELKSMERSIIATPKTREDLETFANACGGSGTLVAVQMAIQFGYKMALDNCNDINEENN
jgi:hypothetical protein